MEQTNYWLRSNGISRREAFRMTGLTGAGIAGAALLGCADAEDERPPATPAPPDTARSEPTDDDVEAKRGGRLGLSRGHVSANFNPVTNANWGHTYAGLHEYDRLISPRLDDRIYVLEAADSLELPDEVTVVARLQEGLVYQDRPPVNGRPVLADDIVTTQEYVQNEPNAIFGSFQLDSLESIEAPDDRTVIFHLTRPNAYLFTGTQLGHPNDQCIIPRELVEGDLDQAEPVGSGPYQLKEYQFQVRYLYERNPTYRRAAEGMPYIDERLLLTLTDSTAIEAAFRAQQTHVWIPPSEAATRVIADLGDQLEVTEALGLNLTIQNISSAREWSHDIRIREALYRVFDAQEYIDLAADGWAVEVPGQLAVGLERYQLDPSETAEYRRHDSAAARQLLEAAGFDFDPVYTVTATEGAANVVPLQVFTEQVRRIGVQTRIDQRPSAEWFQVYAGTGDYDFSVQGHPAYDSPQTPLRLHHTDTRNINAWTNIRDPEIDAMIEESETLLDPDENVALVKDIQLELLRRYAHLFYVYTLIQRQVQWSYVKDWEVNISNQPMYRVEAWLDL